MHVTAFLVAISNMKLITYAEILAISLVNKKHFQNHNKRVMKKKKKKKKKKTPYGIHCLHRCQYCSYRP